MHSYDIHHKLHNSLGNSPLRCAGVLWIGDSTHFPRPTFLKKHYNALLHCDWKVYLLSIHRLRTKNQTIYRHRGSNRRPLNYETTVLLLCYHRINMFARNSFPFLDFSNDLRQTSAFITQLSSGHEQTHQLRGRKLLLIPKLFQSCSFPGIEHSTSSPSAHSANYWATEVVEYVPQCIEGPVGGDGAHQRSLPLYAYLNHSRN